MPKFHKCGQTPNSFNAVKYDWANNWWLVFFTKNKEQLNVSIAIEYCPFCGVNLEKDENNAK